VQDYNAFADVLKKILANEYPAITADEEYDVTLLSDLPPGSVNDDLVRMYRRRIGLPDSDD